jgi:hypothetical protein
VANTGIVNTFDMYGVQKVAFDLLLFELVNYITDNPKSYGKTVLTSEFTNKKSSPFLKKV